MDIWYIDTIHIPTGFNPLLVRIQSPRTEQHYPTQHQASTGFHWRLKRARSPKKPPGSYFSTSFHSPLISAASQWRVTWIPLIWTKLKIEAHVHDIDIHLCLYLYLYISISICLYLFVWMHKFCIYINKKKWYISKLIHQSEPWIHIYIYIYILTFIYLLIYLFAPKASLDVVPCEESPGPTSAGVG